MKYANFTRVYVRFIKEVYVFPKFSTILSRCKKNLLVISVWHDFCSTYGMGITAKILKPETKVVVFDLDGTLYSRKGMAGRMMLGALFDWRLMLAERRTRSSMCGIWVGDKNRFYTTYFQQIAARVGCSENHVHWWYTTRYMPLMINVIRKHLKLAPWVRPFIEQCKQLGIRMVVLSDYGSTHEKLQALGLEEDLFDWVISAPEIGGLKPAPQLLVRVADRLGVSPRQCMVIGDREDTDGEMAKKTGATFYHITNQ